MNVMITVMLAAFEFLGASRGTNTTEVGQMKITSDRSFYDRKEGYAHLGGHVFVEDSRYQLHADEAFIFTNASNELHRIVALGHVAITNETRRAFGEKASYYRTPGLVVLYAGADAPAEVRDEGEKGDQVVRGRKIKFWTVSEQVEVVEAELSAPSSAGSGGVQGLLRR